MKRLKIFKSCWHIGNDADLINGLSDIADFELLINYTRRWDSKNRDFPANASWTTHFKTNYYDLAILNIDQQCSNPDLNKGILMKHMRDVIKEKQPNLPIIWINHATPVYPERYEDGNKENNYVSETLRKEILDIIGNDYMVCNSHQAEKEWNNPNSRAIIHGMEKDEWISDLDKEPRVCTYISAGGIGDKYYNRSYLMAVMEELRENYGINLQWIGSPGCFSPKNIKEYKEFLGKSLLYFNPTFASPMPRSRTEAMLSGCCVITTPQHDAKDFIIDGYNGFLVPHNDVSYTAKLIAKLLEEYKTAKEIGKRGRETAIEKFNRERYRQDWVNLLKDLKIIK